MDIVGRLFVTIFDKLNEKCKEELEAVGKQYPFEPLKVPFDFKICLNLCSIYFLYCMQCLPCMFYGIVFKH